MHCALYRFDVLPGREDEFVERWSAVTAAIRTHFGSRGSRLHRAADGGWVAYAQWPSREAYDAVDREDPRLAPLREQMRACCVNVELVSRMDVVADRLDERV